MKKIALFFYLCSLVHFSTAKAEVDQSILKDLTLFKAQLFLSPCNIGNDERERTISKTENDDEQILNFTKAFIYLTFLKDSTNEIAQKIEIPVQVNTRLPKSLDLNKSLIVERCQTFLIDQLGNKPIASILGTYTSTPTYTSVSSSQFEEAYNQSSQVRLSEIDTVSDFGHVLRIFFNTGKFVIQKRAEAALTSLIIATDADQKLGETRQVSIENVLKLELK